MPSIRSCLASLAFLALALSPIAAASSHGNSHVVARDSVIKGVKIARSPVESPAALLEKRAAAKAAAAKRAVARRAAKAKREVEAVDLEKRGAFKGKATTTAFAAYLTTKCSRNKQCVNAEVKAVLPTNGTPVCNQSTRRCAISCAKGYLLQSDGTCLATAVSCPSLTHGIYTVVDGVCTPSCNTDLGYLLTFSSSGVPRCTNTVTSTSNCGALGIVCQSSYNSIGSALCSRGSCTLRCPVGMFVYTTSTGKVYCA